MTDVFGNRPLASLSGQELLEFLEARIPEADEIEYKQAVLPNGKPHFSPEVLETVVAFANTVGGILFYGVREDPPGRPTEDIPGFRMLPGKPVEVLETAFTETCAVQIEPQVYLETRVVELEPDSGQGAMRLLVVRIRPGLRPPYLLRGRGIYLRVGESDRHASVGEIEALFQRRQNVGLAVQPTGWARVLANVFAFASYPRPAGSPVHLIAGITPVFTDLPAPMTDATDSVFEAICAQFGWAPQLILREPDGVSYQPRHVEPDVAGLQEGHSPSGWAFNDGAIGIRRAIGISRVGSQSSTRVDLARVWYYAAHTLLWARHWTRRAAGYPGIVQFRLVLTDLAGAITEPLSPAQSEPLMRNVRPSWEFSGEWGDQSDLPDLLDSALGTLARQLQYRGYGRVAASVRTEAEHQLRDARVLPD